MKRLAAITTLLAFALTACGSSELGEVFDAVEEANQASQSDGNPAPPAQSNQEPTPEASGELSPNTIRIGSQVWERTLPALEGQCFVDEATDQLPASANAWGTLENDENLSFSASQDQEGGFEAIVDNQFDMYWISGERAPDPKELTIELNYEENSMRGTGLFHLLNTGEQAYGSFYFVCEGE